MMRDSSPPEAIRASGRSSSPGLGDSRNSARSSPRSVQPRGSTAASGSAGVKRHLEARLLHRQLRELGLHALAQLERPRPDAASRARAPAPGSSPPSRSRRASEGPLLLLGRASASSSRRQRSPNASTSSTVAPYFFFRRSTMREAATRSRRGAPGSPRAARGSRAGAAPGPRAARGLPPGRRGSAGTRGRSRRAPRPGGTRGPGARAPRPRRRRAGRTPRRSAPRGARRWPGAPSRRAGPPPRPARGRRCSISPAWNSSISRRRSASRRSPRRRSSAASAARRSRKNSASGRPSSAPAKWSSRSTCVAGSSRPWGSCWPWMTVSRGARSRRRLTGTSAPFTVARPLPLAWSSRRMTTSSPSGWQPALLEERRRVLDFEDRLDRGALFARPDEVGRGPIAQQQAERVDQDRLAGARSRRSGASDRAELDLERRNEGDVVDSQQFKHVSVAPWQNITALRRL